MLNDSYINLSDSALLEKAFAGWSFRGFSFPRKDEVNNGCTGSHCISKAEQLFLRRKSPNGGWQVAPYDVHGLISAHLNFKASCGALKKSSKDFQVAFQEFHLTIRRSKIQTRIDRSGPSILTSGESIHIGPNTPWGRPENIVALVTALANEMPTGEDISGGDLLAFLMELKGYTNAKLKMMAAEFLEDAREHLQQQLGIVVRVNGDASFTGRG